MARIALIDKKKKHQTEVSQYLKDLEVEDLEIQLFDQLQGFENEFFHPELESDHGGSLNLILINYEFISVDRKAFFSELRRKLKKFGWYPEENYTKIVVLKFDDKIAEKIALALPQIDDLIYFPLDRSTFLQKVDILLQLPEKATPRFLFSQETSAPIEISKIVRLEKISDVGFAIENPIALKAGILAHFFIQLPGQDQPLDVFAKTVHSEPHPEKEGQSLVYFGYFGPSKETIGEIRSYLARDSRFRKFISEDPEKFKMNFDDLFMTDDQKKPKVFVIVDFDEDRARSIMDYLKSEIDQVEVIYEPSLSVFFNKYIEASSKESFASQPAQLDDLAGEDTELIIAREGESLQGLSGQQAEAENFLGYPIEELSASPDLWRKIFQQPESEAYLGDVLSLFKEGQRAEHNLNLKTANGKLVKARCFFSAAKESVSLKFGLIETEAPKAAQSKPTDIKIHGLIVDGGQISPGSKSQWAETLVSKMKEANLNAAKNVSILFTNLNENTDLYDFSSPLIRGCYQTPVDYNLLAFDLTHANQIEHSMHKMDNLGFADILAKIHVAKRSELIALSEFGASLKSRTPLQPGHYLYLRGSIFQKAPNNNLCARVIDCSEDPNEKEFNIISLLYFGISDGFKKEARSWFRETYAASKAKG